MSITFPRWLRVLLAFLVVPVVVFANPTTANAATHGTMEFAMETGALSDYLPWTGTTCKLPWVVTSTGVSVGATSQCYGSPDTTPGHCQPYEGACGSYGLVLRGNTGETCGSAAFEPYDNGGGISSVRAGLGAAFVPVTWDDCIVMEACLSYYFDPKLGGTTDWVTCIPFAVDQPNTPVTGACEYGMPSGVTTSVWKGTHPQHGWMGQNELRLKALGVTPFVAGEVREGWNFSYLPTQASTGGVGGWDPVVVPGDHKVAGIQNWDMNPYPPPPGGVVEPNPADMPQPYGVQVWYVTGSIPGNSGNGYGTNNADQKWTGPGSPAFLGTTEPALCRFYFGPKIVDDPNSDKDEPFGEVGGDPISNEPEPTMPVVDPPVDDQPDDELSLWGAILAMLRAILNAIQGFVSAILNGIRDLFVPSDGFLEDKWDGVEAEWQDTSPGKYVDAVADIQTGSVSGCGGLPLDVNLGGGVQVNEHIGAACSGGMATAASIVRVVITAMVAIGGAIACVRAVGSGLGWNPGIRVDS